MQGWSILITHARYPHTYLLEHRWKHCLSVVAAEDPRLMRQLGTGGQEVGGCLE